MTGHPGAQTHSVILTLLTEAASAHGIYEAEHLGGRYDTQWPDWYARHMAEGLDAAGFRLASKES